MTPRTDPYNEPPGDVLFTSEAIQARISELGRRVTDDYAGRDLVLLTVLKGGVVFLADLCRAVDLPMSLEFMGVSQYGAKDPGGVVRITKDADRPLEGKHVLVVEDIVDTGLTLQYLLKTLRQRGPASIEVCTLLDRDVRRLVDLPIAYTGFRIPDVFVVGYGLDWDGRMRNLPYIAALEEERVLG